MTTGAPRAYHQESVPSSSSTGFAINGRYLHAKTRKAVTVRYIGLLPESTDGQTWIGVEYDDPTCGKGHNGTYKGTQVFQTLLPGAGAFIKCTGRTTPLIRGASLIDALEERYGPLGDREKNKGPLTDAAVVLGSSNAAIVVEAPNMDGVRSRIGRLERLREIGFDGEWVANLGGTAAKRLLFKERLKSELSPVATLTLDVNAIDLSNNLIESWAQVAEIAEHLPGLVTLVVKWVPAAMPS